MISQSNVEKFYLLYYKQKQSLISGNRGIDGTEVSRGCGDYTMSLISIKSDVLHFFVAEQLSIADAYLVLNFYHCILDFILTASFTLKLSSKQSIKLKFSTHTGKDFQRKSFLESFYCFILGTIQFHFIKSELKLTFFDKYEDISNRLKRLSWGFPTIFLLNR